LGICTRAGNIYSLSISFYLDVNKLAIDDLDAHAKLRRTVNAKRIRDVRVQPKACKTIVEQHFTSRVKRFENAYF
jgi:hypothetical protein